jgi:hypothetical protein
MHPSLQIEAEMDLLCGYDLIKPLGELGGKGGQKKENGEEGDRRIKDEFPL